MNSYIQNIDKQIKILEKTQGGTHIKTSEVRKLSSKLYSELSDKSKESVFFLCELLLEQRNWAMGVIAYDFAYRMKKYYDETTYHIFESWLIKYVRGWGDCDDFCTHAFGELLIQNPELSTRILSWIESEDFWMRRAAAVVFILPIQKGVYDREFLTMITDKLMEDEHDLVRKGYGWMLKILAGKELEFVTAYLLANKERMPRVSYRYAIDNMDKEMRRMLLEA